MAKWEVIDQSNKTYSYQGFKIKHSMKIVNRQAKEFLEGVKEIINEEGDQELVTVNATADTFSKAKKSICEQIDSQ